MHVARLAALALLAGTAGCTAPDHEPPAATPPDTSAERAATAVFGAYIEAVASRRPREACRLLVAEAARTHGCDTTPTVPAEIRAAGRPEEAVLVRDASSYDAQMHLSALVQPTPTSGGHLIAFLDRRGRRWLIKQVTYGNYG